MRLFSFTDQSGFACLLPGLVRRMCELIHTRRSKLRQLILPRRSVNVGSRLSPWSISRATLPIRSRLGSSAPARSRPRLLFGPHVAERASRWRSAHLVEKAVCELCAPPDLAVARSRRQDPLRGKSCLSSAVATAAPQGRLRRFGGGPVKVGLWHISAVRVIDRLFRC